MRVDKYLKVSRLIKRRTVAKEASDASKILVNGKIAKPSTILKIGDVITINFFKKKIVAKVLSLNTVVKKDEAQEMYEIIEVVEN